MTAPELSDLMHAGERHVGAPDLDRIHRGGRRRRRLRRAAVAVSVAAVVGGVAAIVAMTGQPGTGSDGAVVRPVAPNHQVTSLTRFEKRVLASVPGAYAVDGTVIVPGGLDTTSPATYRMGANRLVGAQRPLGFHAYGGGARGGDYPKFMRGTLPKDAQVLTDDGPTWLGCTSWPDRPGECVPSVLGRAAGTFYYLYGLGKDDFLDPGAEMEIFTDDDYTGKSWHSTLIGGFDGTAATRIEITMVDGRTVDATVDRGTISKGDTLFWAKMPAEAANVAAYDADGDVVARHHIRDCASSVDCEVR